MLAVANGDVRLGGAVHPDPLVGVVSVRKGTGSPSSSAMSSGVRRQRLPDLRRARDRRRARRGGVVRRPDGRRLAGQRLVVAGIVGEAHRHLDRRALVGRHQRVGACRRLGDVRLSVVGPPGSTGTGIVA